MCFAWGVVVVGWWVVPVVGRRDWDVAIGRGVGGGEVWGDVAEERLSEVGLCGE